MSFGVFSTKTADVYPIFAIKTVALSNLDYEQAAESLVVWPQVGTAFGNMDGSVDAFSIDSRGRLLSSGGEAPKQWVGGILSYACAKDEDNIVDCSWL